MLSEKRLNMFCTMLLNNCYGAAITSCVAFLDPLCHSPSGICHHMELSTMEPAVVPQHPWWNPPPLYFFPISFFLSAYSSFVQMFFYLFFVFSLILSVVVLVFHLFNVFMSCFLKNSEFSSLFFRVSEFSFLFIRISESCCSMFFLIKPIMLFPILIHIQDFSL